MSKPVIKKCSWTPEEDAILVQLVAIHGPRRWSKISLSLPGRVGKQCRERWHNHLSPDVRKDAWTKEEDTIIFGLVNKIGTKWAAIAKQLHGRTDNAIKNRYYSSLKKHQGGMLPHDEVPTEQSMSSKKRSRETTDIDITNSNSDTTDTIDSAALSPTRAQSPTSSVITESSAEGQQVSTLDHPRTPEYPSSSSSGPSSALFPQNKNPSVSNSPAVDSPNRSPKRIKTTPIRVVRQAPSDSLLPLSLPVAPLPCRAPPSALASTPAPTAHRLQRNLFSAISVCRPPPELLDQPVFDLATNSLQDWNQALVLQANMMFTPCVLQVQTTCTQALAPLPPVQPQPSHATPVNEAPFDFLVHPSCEPVQALLPLQPLPLLSEYHSLLQ